MSNLVNCAKYHAVKSNKNDLNDLAVINDDFMGALNKIDSRKKEKEAPKPGIMDTISDIVSWFSNKSRVSSFG